MHRSFESLESRRILSAALKHTHVKQPKVGHAFPIEHIASPHGGVAPYASSYTPSQLRAAYGFDQINIPGLTADGAGQTIPIVDAYDNPNFVSTASANFANSDLHKFDVAFGLQDPPSFLKVNQTGGTTMPAT